MFLLFILMFLPLAFILKPFVSPAGLTPTARVVGYLCMLALLWALGMAVGSVAEPFISSCWTVAYRHLSGLGQMREKTT
jgi:hypothetical protein